MSQFHDYNPNIAVNTAPHAGMPALDASAQTTSWFEFAPTSLFYAPIYLFCGLLSLRHLGVSLPTNANPGIPFSGLVGESKSEVLNTVSGPSRALIAPYVKVMHRTDPAQTLSDALSALDAVGGGFPVVVKPDLGMRGAGVQVAKSVVSLEKYIQSFPAGADFLLQRLVPQEGEAGVFYVRHPDWETGKIISLTLKYFPRVTGDGRSNLRQLIEQDPRAGKLQHLYLDRFKDQLDDIIAHGQSVRLAFAGNHCRGTLFRNGNDHITPALTKAFDKVARDMGEFYIGRFDVRFGDFDALKQGKDFRIIEVNGAGGEATHIWDARTTLPQAYKTLMAQYAHIYTIGAKNRKRGFKAPALRALIKAWQQEKRLTENYPITH